MKSDIESLRKERIDISTTFFFALQACVAFVTDIFLLLLIKRFTDPGTFKDKVSGDEVSFVVFLKNHRLFEQVVETEHTEYDVKQR